jgi:hypothetical protein
MLGAARQASGHSSPHRVMCNLLSSNRSDRLGGHAVAMVETTDSRHCQDFGGRICIRRCHSTRGRPLLQREVRPIVVVIANVFSHQPFEMPLVEHDYMIEQVPSAITNPSFCNTVLPRTTEAGPLGLDAKALHCADNFLVEVRCAIEDQVGGHLVTRKGLAQLLRDPRTAWMPCNVEMKYTPPVMRDYKEAMQHSKPESRHGEEIHRSNRFSVVTQKRRPSLRWLRFPGCPPHPAQNSSLREVEPKHFQFAVDARRAPGSVLRHHAEDEFAQFPAYTSSADASAVPRDPFPVPLEPGTMPADDGFGSHYHESIFPARP